MKSKTNKLSFVGQVWARSSLLHSLLRERPKAQNSPKDARPAPARVTVRGERVLLRRRGWKF